MSKKNSVIIIIVVVLLATLITYLVSKNRSSQSNISETKNLQSQPVTGANLNTSNQNYTPHTSLVASMPGPKASSSDIQNYLKQVDSVAVNSTTLDISGCVLSPDIIQAKIGVTLTLNNNDEYPHTITYPVSGFLLEQGAVSSTGSVTVPRKGKAVLVLDKVPHGVYGVGCEAATTTQGRIGILEVNP